MTTLHHMMTDDEIESLLRATQSEGYPSDVRRLVHAVQAAERERCAKLCQQVAEENANQDSYHWYGCMDCKTAIEGIKDQAIHPAHSAPDR